MATARKKDSQLSAKYRRLVTRRGENTARVAIMRTLLTLIWQMAGTGEVYHDLGGDYYLTRDPTRAKRRAMAQLQALGFQVTLTPVT